MSFSNHQVDLKKKAAALASNAVSYLASLDALYTQHFGAHTKPSAVHQAFSSNNALLVENTTCLAALHATNDAIMQATSDLSTLSDYITVHIPTMEDGNNFGVTVQLAALKELKDTSEGLVKLADELLPKYYSTRADAFDKLGLVESNSATESTKQEVENGGDTKKTTTSETKTTKASTSPPPHRVQAVVAIDVQFFFKAQAALRAIKSAYVANLDFLLKNKDKLEAPKGTDGGSNFSSMY